MVGAKTVPTQVAPLTTVSNPAAWRWTRTHELAQGDIADSEADDMQYINDYIDKLAFTYNKDEEDMPA